MWLIMRALVLGLMEESENSDQVIASLKQSGDAVHAVDSFPKALEIFSKPVKFDLIISDVHLQNGGTVFDFLKWVRRNPETKDVPFVLFSFRPAPVARYLDDSLRTTARLLGATKYITMDAFDDKEFCKQIDSLLPQSENILELNTKESSE